METIAIILFIIGVSSTVFAMIVVFINPSKKNDRLRRFGQYSAMLTILAILIIDSIKDNKAVNTKCENDYNDKFMIWHNGYVTGALRMKFNDYSEEQSKIDSINFSNYLINK